MYFAKIDGIEFLIFLEFSTQTVNSLATEFATLKGSDYKSLTMNEPIRTEESVEEINMNTVPLENELPSVEPEVDTTTQVNVEEFTISGDDLVGKVRELIHQGNIRRIIVKNEEDQVLIEIPLTVGVVGGVVGVTLFPVIAAVGAIGALVARLKLVIERRE